MALAREWIWYPILADHSGRLLARNFVSLVVAVVLVAVGLTLYRKQAGTLGRSLLSE